MIARPLQIDYVAPPRRARLAGFVLLALSLVAAGMLIERYRDVKVELERAAAGRGLLNAEQRPARPVSRERLQEEAKSAEAVLRQLALPWNAIVETVEEAATADVAILQMQPDAQQRQLRLAAEARTQEAMLVYVRGLVAAKSLADVHVVSHQVQMDDPQRPIQFTVQASLKGLP
jgi:hypothetical protein